MYEYSTKYVEAKCDTVDIDIHNNIPIQICKLYSSLTFMSYYTLAGKHITIILAWVSYTGSKVSNCEVQTRHEYHVVITSWLQ